MRDTNVVILIGRLGKDPKRITDTLAVFSIAVQDDYYSAKSKEVVKKTSWIDIAAGGYLAKNALEYLKAGQRVCVTGKLDQRKWETESGDKRSVIQVKAEDIQFLDRIGDAETAKFAQDNSGDESEDFPF